LEEITQQLCSKFKMEGPTKITGEVLELNEHGARRNQREFYKKIKSADIDQRESNQFREIHQASYFSTISKLVGGIGVDPSPAAAVAENGSSLAADVAIIGGLVITQVGGLGITQMLRCSCFPVKQNAT
jgi:hypothetical protein